MLYACIIVKNIQTDIFGHLLIHIFEMGSFSKMKLEV